MATTTANKNKKQRDARREKRATKTRQQLQQLQLQQQQQQEEQQEQQQQQQCIPLCFSYCFSRCVLFEKWHNISNNSKRLNQKILRIRNAEQQQRQQSNDKSNVKVL